MEEENTSREKKGRFTQVKVTIDETVNRIRTITATSVGSVPDLTDHGTEEAPLLVPTWSQTKTLQGLEADDLAKDVRARRGTVMQTKESSSTEPLLAEQKWSVSGVSETKSLSRTGNLVRNNMGRLIKHVLHYVKGRFFMTNN